MPAHTQLVFESGIGNKMSFLYVSAIKRQEKSTSNHGGLAIVDVDSWGITYRTEEVYPLPFCARNNNPRGGTRGWRGIACWQDLVVVANNDSLVFFDPQLDKVKKIISHPSFAGLHGVEVCGDLLYVASTASDTYAVVDNRMNVSIHDPFKDNRLLGVIKPWLDIRGRAAPVFSSKRDYREKWVEDVIHLNYITTNSGKMYALFNSLDILIQLKPEPKILWAPPIAPGIYSDDPPPVLPYLACPHDLTEYSPGKLLINSSRMHTLHSFDTVSGELRSVWSGKEAGHHWLRGIQVIGSSAYIGTTDGVLLEVDITAGKKIRELSIFDTSEELRYAIFSVCQAEGLSGVR